MLCGGGPCDSITGIMAEVLQGLYQELLPVVISFASLAVLLALFRFVIGRIRLWLLLESITANYDSAKAQQGRISVNWVRSAALQRDRSRFVRERRRSRVLGDRRIATWFD